MVDDASNGGIATDTGERRIVTILFADVVSSTRLTAELDPDDIKELMDHAMAVMANAVRTYGGAVVRFQGDGIKAMFGAPRPAEDHAVRACLAGLAIQKAFAAHADPANAVGGQRADQLKVRVGIHSGLVIAREVDTDVGHGLDLVGATVSLAALAEKVCPVGAVTATTATADLAGAFLQARPFEPVGHELAGRFKFVEVVGVTLSARSILAGSNPNEDLFVGRIDEQKKILQALEQTAVGGRIIGLVGDPGIGKSRLSIEIARSAAARQMRVYQIRGLSLTQATPYAPIRGFLWALLGIEDRPDTETAGKIAGSLGLSGAELAGLLELLGTENKQPSGRETERQEQREKVLGAFCSTVGKAWGQHPTLLVVDDLQLLDSETVACLRRLAGKIRETRALIVVNGRSETLQAMRRLTDEIIDLPPLGKDHLLEIVASLAPYIAEDGELADRIAERSGGVPFVLEQILGAMSRQGNSLDDRVLPTSVESIVLARLNQLSGDAKRLAQIASVLGEETDYRLLQRLAGSFRGETESCVAELVNGGFFSPVVAGTVRFKHSLIRDACLDSIVRPERRRLHGEALSCIEAHFDALAPYFEQLAYHAEGAGRDDVAIEYLWSASKIAARNSAVHSLAILFERAMACCERLGGRGEKREVDFVLLAFDAMQQHGKVMSVVPRLGRAAELARQQGRKDRECLAHAHLATILWFQAQHEEGRKLAERAVALARDIRTPPALFYAQLTLANLRYGCGDIPGAIELLQSNIEFLTGELEQAHLGAIVIPSVMSRSFLAWYQIDQGRFREAGQNIEHAVKVADADGRPYSRVLAHTARGRLSYERGDYTAAIDILSPVRDWCWQHRIYAMEPNVSGLLASALCRTGAGRAGLAATEASIGKQFFRGAARMACYYLFVGHGESLLACGDTSRGREIIAKAVGQTQTPYDPCLCVLGHVLQGQVFLSAGEIARARPEFEWALKVALQIGMLPSAARAHEGLAQCSRKTSDREFRQHADAAVGLYRQCDLTVPVPLLS